MTADEPVEGMSDLDDLMGDYDHDTVTVTLTDIPTDAITDAVLAMESFAARMYGARAHDPDEQRRYNALGLIVVPLRNARDDALA